MSGWTNVNCAPETWNVQDELIHCTGKPTGALRTVRQYENFILELEWRHLSSGGNSGVFIWATPIAAPGVPFLRGIEVQVLDNGYSARGKNQWYTTHGDVFPIHGATMEPFGRHNGTRSFPSEERSKSSPDWNQYRIVCSNGVLRLSVNGKEVSGGQNCNYRKGYLGLESEGGPIDFRNIRLQELPATPAPALLTAPEDLGWRSLFTGLDLRGWKTNGTSAQLWTARGERLALKSNTSRTEGTLWAERAFADAAFVVDCRPAKPAGNHSFVTPAVQLRGHDGKGFELPLTGARPDQFQRFVITVKGRDVTLALDGKEPQHSELAADAPTRGQFGLSATAGAAEFMNLYARDL